MYMTKESYFAPLNLPIDTYLIITILSKKMLWAAKTIFFPFLQVSFQRRTLPYIY